MLNWIFKKRDAASVTAPAPAPALDLTRRNPASRVTAAHAASAPAPAAPRVHDAPEWAARLRAAQGDDALLLALALQAPVIELKCAAVAAIHGEAVLRQAEREFRSHDRKAHRLAKQRLEAAIVQREARASAQDLLARTQALLDAADVPLNHVVALDRDWQALPAPVLEPGQRERYAELRAALDTLLRERGLTQQRLQRWSGEAQRFLQAWPAAAAMAAAQGGAAEAASLGQAVAALRAERPVGPVTSGLEQALAQAQQTAAALEARLAWFETSAPAVPVEEGVTAAEVSSPGMADTWDTLPGVPDDELSRLLAERHERLLLERRPPPAPEPPLRPARPARKAGPTPEQRERLDAALQQAEAALAAGHLGELQAQLQALDAAVSALHVAAMPEAWRARVQALRFERDRLKGWQQWGGGRAREDLADAAEALGSRTRAATDEAAAPELKPQKLNLKTHAEAIQALRTRWKDLDRLGAAATAAQWQRFDTALQLAFQPVAAQHAAQQAARETNLQAREALLAALEALPDPEEAPDARALLRELERFQSAWRKLGPVEHTVPAAARAAVQQRQRAALERIEGPLNAARQRCAAEREQLVLRAEALPAAAAGAAPFAELARQVRELQAQWKDHARALPLPRAMETALWTRFKAATDAVFVGRDAALAARKQAYAAERAAREALLRRLSDLDGGASAADIQRVLAEADRAWRDGGELRRDGAADLDARWRSARAAALARLEAARRQAWQAQCEQLAARLALCEQREEAPDTAGLDARWVALAGLPAAWQKAFDARWAAGPGPGPLPAAQIDELLLRLETVLDMPATAQQQAARRQLKLREMKDRLEGRTTALQGSAAQAQWLLAAWRQGGLDAAGRARVRALAAALRDAAPGMLGAPTAP